MFERPRSGERALLVRIGLGEPARAEDLEEFAQLALSAGAQPVATVTGRRDRPDPRYFVGSGKAAEIGEVARAESADVILIDHPLSPSQERNLEKLIGKRVLDRSGLILDIFAQRARSFEGQLEVELAQLKHIATRLGTFGEVSYALAPKAVDQILHMAYKVFPESAAAKGQPDTQQKANMEQIAMANLMKGVHW